MKNLFLVLMMALVVLGFQTASADYASTPQPYPNHYQPYPPQYQPYPGHYGPYPYPYPTYPVPAYPQPVGVVTCFAQGMINGVLFYGVGYNVYQANQWAQYACQSTGQYCQSTGCR